MAFRLHPSDHDATTFLRRLAAEELGAMSATAGVHDARKRVKKMRAALRLVRSGFRRAADEGAVLRDAAQGLSGQRDAEVMLAVFDRLAAPGEAPALRAHLAARIAAAGDDGAAFATFLSAVAPVRDRSSSWVVKGKTSRVLKAGLTLTRERGRRAMVQALRSGPESEAMHDWRKRIKDLWYQARLFQPVWPEAMDPVVTAAGDLGEALGDHHDLVVFREVLAGLADTPALAADAAAMRDRAEPALAAIAGAAREQGARLLAGDADAVAAQWVDLWRLWRHQH
jgi:CHAD domain-containing protein